MVSNLKIRITSSRKSLLSRFPFLIPSFNWLTPQNLRTLARFWWNSLTCLAIDVSSFLCIELTCLDILFLNSCVVFPTYVKGPFYIRFQPWFCWLLAKIFSISCLFPLHIHHTFLCIWSVLLLNPCSYHFLTTLLFLSFLLFNRLF